MSVIIEDNETEEMNEEGIKNIVVEVNWPMKDKNGEYLLYLSEVSLLFYLGGRGYFEIDQWTGSLERDKKRTLIFHLLSGSPVAEPCHPSSES